VYRVESSGHKSARGQGRTLEMIITTLEKHGVEFIEIGEKAPALKLSPPLSPPGAFFLIEN
jgi:hypothetical protein